MQELAVWINIILYCSLLIGFQLKVRSVRLGTLALLIYALSVIAGLIFFNSILSNFTNLQIFPFIFLFILFLFIMYPILQFDAGEIKKITFNHDVIRWLSLFVGLISIIPSIEITFLLTKVGQMDQSVFSEIHKMKNQGEGAMDELQLSGVSRPFYFFISRLADITPILLFLSIASPKRNWVNIALLILAIYCVNGMGVIQGGRSALTYTAVYLFALYLIFKDFLPSGTKRLVVRYGVISLSAIVVIFLFITFARFNVKSIASEVSVVDWISLYAGEGSLYFNEYIWNMRGTTEGDYCFSYFKQLLNFASVDGVERRDYWVLKTNIPQQVFYTFMGNIIEDLGKVWGAIFLIVVSFFVRHATKVKNKSLDFSSIIILCIWCKIIFSGITFYTYGGSRAEILLTNLALAFVCLFIKKNGAIYNKTNQE